MKRIIEILIKHCEVGMSHVPGKGFHMSAKGPLGVAGLIVLTVVLINVIQHWR
jgi:hypothetical protein